MLELKNLQKTFFPGTPNEHVVLSGLDLTVRDGEFVTIIGSNGAGKSTLFNAICGNVELDGGSVTLNGRDITFTSESRRALHIGRVFQDPMKGTAPSMSIEENLALAYSRRRNRPFSRAINRKDRAFFRDSLARYGLGLEDRMKTKVGLLSGGQRQVVTLLMCTLVMPELLLLDEHTAALDPATAEKIMEITCQIVSENKLTTLMITHNVKSALTTGSRTLMLDNGTIAFDISGETREGMSVEQLLRLYTDKRSDASISDRMLFG
ncbi:MAG: ATP-binding cassette domain-containing protein [Ruminococcaceae bacterium]|nr:ATP-binding cassette domain-containing protein [Oscillospiraceae bacterium]